MTPRFRLCATPVVGLLALAGWGFAAHASEGAPATQPATTAPTAPGAKRGGPLAGLPSKPGAHVEKIDALRDNEWLNLGAPAPDPRWGRARGRSWTFKMPFAPELRGAFLYGTGVHGYVKPDGHYQDDLFFYDINGHRWICCYPGLDLKPEAPNLTINEQGWEVDASGQPIPVITGHAWGHVTYDTDRRLFVFAREGGTPYESLMAKRGKWWSREIEQKAKPHSPWAWNTHTGRWECRLIITPHPPYGNGDTFIYVPSRKQFFHIGRATYNEGVVHFYDPAAGTWSRVKPGGPKPATLYDATSCYDPGRDRIYIGGGQARGETDAFLWIYDLKTDTWIDPKPKGTTITRYSTNVATMRYDAASDAVVVCAVSDHPQGGYTPAQRGIHVYDPKTNAWLGRASPLPEGFAPGRNALAAAFYDPALNAHFFHVANDSRDNGIMWAYRYRRRGGPTSRPTSAGSGQRPSPQANATERSD